jgi:phosphatidylserine/phosphatidylglycerophosphate/cardiolipin synthase-like enzyme
MLNSIAHELGEFISYEGKLEDMEYYCNICKKPISPAVFEYSTKNFGKPLCRNCQDKQRATSTRSYKATRTVSPKPKHPEEEISVIAGAQKVWKGVSKAIKERSIIGERDFNKWIADWRHTKRGLDFSLEFKHFFLGGPDLDEFTKSLINMAEKTVLVANPFVEPCYLTDYLIESASKGIEVKIVTRYPEAKEKKKIDCHSKLREMNVSLRYDNRIHSKIVVVDNKVAIVSSMNFYSGSSGGASNEAGIVSIEEKVVKSTENYIKKLL